MRKFLLLAVALMVTMVAVPASASVQNIKISGAIDNTYLWRDDFDFGRALRGDLRQNIFITQTQLQVDADLTDQVSATVSLINERVWEADPSDASTNIDINEAYVTLREMLYSPLTVVVGRQSFSYGNSLIIDSTGPNHLAPVDSPLDGVAEDLTKQTAQDAVRLIFDYNPLTVELLFSKIHPNTAAAAITGDNDDQDLWGINTTYELGDELNTVVEGYFFASYNRNTQGNLPAVGKVDTIYVPGFRASTNVLEGLNLQIEYAHQFGTKADSTDASNQQNRSADAFQFISNYSVPDDLLPDSLAEVDPVLQYVYTFVSGQEIAGTECSEPPTAGAGCSSEEWRAWDPLYENQGGGTIYNSIFPLTNAHIHLVSVETNPMEDVTSTLSWTGIWLHQEIDKGLGGVSGDSATVTAFVQPGGTDTQAFTFKSNESFVGQEIDLVTTYDYTEDVQFGVNAGIFLPGSALNGQIGGVGNEDAASQLIVNANVNF